MQSQTPLPFEQQVLDRLDRIDADIKELRTDLKEVKTEVGVIKTDSALNQKWQDRTWDVVKWVGGISSALAISAAIALVGLLFRLTR